MGANISEGAVCEALCSLPYFFKDIEYRGMLMGEIHGRAVKMMERIRLCDLSAEFKGCDA